MACTCVHVACTEMCALLTVCSHCYLSGRCDARSQTAVSPPLDPEVSSLRLLQRDPQWRVVYPSLQVDRSVRSTQPVAHRRSHCRVTCQQGTSQVTTNGERKLELNLTRLYRYQMRAQCSSTNAGPFTTLRMTLNTMTSCR